MKEGGYPKVFKPVDLAIPMFGYSEQSSLSEGQARRPAHIGIDRAHRLIRTWDASAKRVPNSF